MPNSNPSSNCFTCADGTRLPLSFRRSKKAKNQRLSLSHTGTLEVVFPARISGRVHEASQAKIDEFLEKHRGWIERAVRRTQPQREAYAMSKAAGLPTHINFPLAKEIWLIEYRQTAAKSITVRQAGLRRIDGVTSIYALNLSGNTSDTSFCSRALQRFLAKRAKECIPPFAQQICAEIGATPNSITVNNRESAWGVCTQKGDIRIDRKVLLLPADLARQVILHEAAHLKHLNHSGRFYDLLFSYDDSTKEAEAAVKKAIQLIPAWALMPTSKA